MVKYQTIIKIIEEELKKCKATAQAKKIGLTAHWEHYDDGDGYVTDIVTYGDGTRIEFDNFSNVVFSDNDYSPNPDYNYWLNISRDKVLEKYGEEGLEFYKEYTLYKQSRVGMFFNEYLRGKMTIEEVYAKIYRYVPDTTMESWHFKDGVEITDYLLENSERYMSMCNELDLNGVGDFYTIRKVDKLHDNDNADKRIVKDKGYTSSSTSGHTSIIDGLFHGPEENNWLIITKYKDGNLANHGMHLAYAEQENYGWHDWDEVLNAPNQKFKRTIIDEPNHIIVQEPYEP